MITTNETLAAEFGGIGSPWYPEEHVTRRT